jgi:NAD(P)-dependent dehydrogenase (short-subunit alcohol dehydrogenase family)
VSKENWTTENIPDLKGQTTIVTGANTGLGKETAKSLAEKNALVVMAVRNIEKGEKAALEIQREIPGSTIKVMELNLSNLESVKDFADTFKKENSQLNLLINNAGVMMPPYSTTDDGFELQFGTNHLGHFALTGHLIALLTATKGARVINVSSGAHNWGEINFDDLQWENREYKKGIAYGDSKIANLYFTYELSRKIRDSDLKVLAAHPGWTATDLQRHSGLFSFLNPFFAQKPQMGALPTLRAATDLKAASGDYYGPDGRREIKGYPVKVQSNTLSKDENIAQKLWDVSEQLTGVKFG